jgi:two-component sensor histidine kinase
MHLEVRVLLQSSRYRQLRLIVNELVTSTMCYARIAGREGKVNIELMYEGSFAHCIVSDNGAEFVRARSLCGLKTAHQLANGLGGWIGHWFDDETTSLVVTFLLTEREQQANESYFGG